MSRTAKHGFEWIRHRSSISSAGRRQGAMCVMQFMGQGATFTDYVQIRMCEIAARAPPAEQCVQCVAYLISIGVWEIAANACIFFLSFSMCVC